ncbi:Casein kinase I isoform beta [Gracilariopsis chorda]|uniref:Casein kinase I isoform beta n=1 Tax=Gracilariopsis chorda TaxID=448386 RepID=A0A2V3IE89_9FLOR|nr:Casein kinase I isoform beta [Gracilariopsis chorda]|eukprot:PXF40383.1 Casein kinase I isoform beta [Gracilariopsis chorda]
MVISTILEDDHNVIGKTIKHRRKKHTILGTLDPKFSERVYLAGATPNTVRSAIKVERIHDHGNNVPEEHSLYKYLQSVGFINIPKVLCMKSDGKFTYLVLECLNKNLHRRLMDKSAPLSLETVLYLSVKAFKMVEELHSVGVLHGLISPRKIMTGSSPSKEEELYIVGFRYSVNLVTHPIPSKTLPIMETMFASLTLHEVGHATMTGDLESLFFSMVFLYKGTLPWSSYCDGIGKFCVHGTMHPLYKAKKAMSSKELLEGLPDCFVDAFRQIRCTPHFELPSYQRIYQPLEDYLTSKFPQKKSRIEWL